ncbi:MAG: DUF4013 domain-containing protein [Candidatus Brockarchaeota archaeon]|nr:DUF4013 domain-containing protein [Candidatus Brockarchaeota archaeon]MBO3809076.1 DUF4013 domain-containing protein [Candidatus Brockarchaeota archaeon]
MEIFESFSKSVDYVSKLLSRGAELIVMIIVNIIPIVNFIFLGYCAKIFKEGPAKDEPPKFENFGELFGEGLKIFVVGLLWALLPLIILVLAFVLTVPWYWIGGGLGFARLGVTFIIALFIVLLAVIGVGIFGVIGLLLTAKTGEIAKGFSFQQIMAVINSVGFANHVIWVILAAIVAFIVGLLGTLPLIGWLIALVISPLLATFLTRAATLFYSDAVEKTLLPPPPPPPLTV